MNSPEFSSNAESGNQESPTFQTHVGGSKCGRYTGHSLCVLGVAVSLSGILGMGIGMTKPETNGLFYGLGVFVAGVLTCSMGRCFHICGRDVEDNDWSVPTPPEVMNFSDLREQEIDAEAQQQQENTVQPTTE